MPRFKKVRIPNVLGLAMLRCAERGRPMQVGDGPMDIGPLALPRVVGAPARSQAAHAVDSEYREDHVSHEDGGGLEDAGCAAGDRELAGHHLPAAQTARRPPGCARFPSQIHLDAVQVMIKFSTSWESSRARLHPHIPLCQQMEAVPHC